MKKIYLLLFMAIFNQMAAIAQEQVFSIGNNGDIVTKAKFIEELYSGNYNNVTPYTLKFSESIKACAAEDKGLNAGLIYTVEGLRYKGWENESGDFNVIEVLFSGKTLLTLKYADGWDKMSTDYSDYTSKFCGIEKLSDDTFAAIFKGVDIMSQPPYLTIIVMKDGKAKVVFNKPMTINSINANADGSKTFDLQENVVEWIDENTPANSPITHTMTIKDGNIYFK